MLDLVIENLMTQWWREKNRYGRGETPSRLNSVLTKEINITREVEYQCPLNRSDHEINFCTRQGNIRQRMRSIRMVDLTTAKLILENTYFENRFGLIFIR